MKERNKDVCFICKSMVVEFCVDLERMDGWMVK